MLRRKVLSPFALVAAIPFLALASCRPDPAAGANCSVGATPDGHTVTECMNLGDVGGGVRHQRAVHYCDSPWAGFDHWQYGAWQNTPGVYSVAINRCHTTPRERSVVVAYVSG